VCTCKNACSSTQLLNNAQLKALNATSIGHLSQWTCPAVGGYVPPNKRAFKTVRTIEDLTLDFIEDSQREKLWLELFDVEVRIIDDTSETDEYFMHD
jgi:hypothetical protein